MYVYICCISLKWNHPGLTWSSQYMGSKKQMSAPKFRRYGQRLERQSGPPAERSWGVCPPHPRVPSPTVETSEPCSQQARFYLKPRAPSVRRRSSGCRVKALHVYSCVSECRRIPGSGRSPEAQEAP